MARPIFTCQEEGDGGVKSETAVIVPVLGSVVRMVDGALYLIVTFFNCHRKGRTTMSPGILKLQAIKSNFKGLFKRMHCWTNIIKHFSNSALCYINLSYFKVKVLNNNRLPANVKQYAKKALY